MGRKRTPGLYKRQGIWHIDKQAQGKRLCESCGTDNLEEAEKYLARRLEILRQATVYGIRPKREFREAATKFLLENQHKATINVDARTLLLLDDYIGHLPLETVHMGSLQKFIQTRQSEGVKNRTINHGLQVVRRILNLAATEWMDEFGLTWILVAPKIKLLPEKDERKPYPLNWEEQTRLLKELPTHLRRMALFAVNTGCRDQEICNLQWSWESPLPNGESAFLIPGQFVKNREDRLVVLNKIARSVIEEVRNDDPKFVFIFRGKPVKRILNSGWKNGRELAQLPNVRVHDLKHTFGRRLRAAGVSFEDRQDLLGHKSARITTHYSLAEFQNLVDAANKVCEVAANNSGFILLKSHTLPSSRKSPASDFAGGVENCVRA